MKPVDLDRLFAERLQPLQASAIREICRLHSRPELRSLAGGWPDPATFPVEETRTILADVLTRFPDAALQYAPPEGIPELRRFLAGPHVLPEGMRLTPEEILVVHGSQQGMDLATAAFLDPGDVALVGLPTYFGGTGAVCACGGELIGVPVDGHGLDVDLLERRLRDVIRTGRRPKLVYVVPNFQNPDGSTLPLERRRRIVQLASEYELIVLEDDPYGDLRYDGDPLPSLKALDADGRVVLVRSFSKTVAAGLRLAWMAAPAAAIRRLAVLKQYRDSCTNSLSQYLVHELLVRGTHQERLHRLREHYRAKRDLTQQLLCAHFPPEVTWNRPEGGFFVWVTLPEWMDGEEILRAALDRDVAFVAGRPFYFDRSGANTIRLSFSQSSPETIEFAVRTLGEVLHARLAAKRRSTPPPRHPPPGCPG